MLPDIYNRSAPTNLAFKSFGYGPGGLGTLTPAVLLKAVSGIAPLAIAISMIEPITVDVIPPRKPLFGKNGSARNPPGREPINAFAKSLLIVATIPASVPATKAGVVLPPMRVRVLLPSIAATCTMVPAQSVAKSFPPVVLVELLGCCTAS
jgi:hypothetical protein